MRLDPKPLFLIRRGPLIPNATCLDDQHTLAFQGLPPSLQATIGSLINLFHFLPPSCRVARLQDRG
jgi:hypothetical protein